MIELLEESNFYIITSILSLIGILIVFFIQNTISPVLELPLSTTSSPSPSPSPLNIPLLEPAEDIKRNKLFHSGMILFLSVLLSIVSIALTKSKGNYKFIFSIFLFIALFITIIVLDQLRKNENLDTKQKDSIITWFIGSIILFLVYPGFMITNQIFLCKPCTAPAPAASTATTAPKPTT